ncbi:phage tail protein [Nocardia bovistercoris]|uniref:Phage tail protein n=1 Tax=Nocardia bovistercoris TaxID=2785916 RepID=A0A931I757_9NOCA|nr:phage tail protein [Nocardia bovistercoris]MBH0775022.1 phage tail protein [Nocardia bovistercoris]
MAPNAAMITVTGVDGSIWTIAGQGRGREGVELATSPSGLYDAPVTTIWNQSAFQVGSSFGGYRTNKRDVVFALNISEAAGRSWEAVDSAWRKAWAYDRDSTLTITTDFGTRSLKLRMSEQPDFKPDKDPHLKRWGKVVMTCTAGNPWWVESDVTGVWTSTISTTAPNTSQSGTLRIANPTDQPMWLKWVCSAPGKWTLPDYSWGADSGDAARTIILPVTTTGQDLTIDTDPMEEMIVAADRSQIWALMNGVSFLYPVPPYTAATDVTVSVTGAPLGASVLVVQPRNWSRPWGLQ